MKLLLDQNLSPRLVNMLGDIFPGSIHVSDVGLESASDVVVWEYARDNDLLITSKDSDLSEISMVRGFPPSVVWIRRGNCSTYEIERLLRANAESILELSRSAASVTRRLRQAAASVAANLPAVIPICLRQSIVQAA